MFVSDHGLIIPQETHKGHCWTWS